MRDRQRKQGVPVSGVHSIEDIWGYNDAELWPVGALIALCLSRGSLLLTLGVPALRWLIGSGLLDSLRRYLRLTNESHPMTSVRERSRMPSTTRMMPVAAA